MPSGFSSRDCRAFLLLQVTTIKLLLLQMQRGVVEAQTLSKVPSSSPSLAGLGPHFVCFRRPWKTCAEATDNQNEIRFLFVTTGIGSGPSIGRYDEMRTQDGPFFSLFLAG